MRLNYGEIWNEAVGLARRERSVVVALAGALYFLPNLLVGYLAPMEPSREGVSFLEAVAAHLRANWPLILAGGLVEMLGTLTLLRLFLKPEGRTVGATIAASLALLPTMFAAAFVSNLMIFAGLLLLIVPGVYLLGRLALAAPAIVAEELRNPFEAVRRSLALTRNSGFAVAGILIVVLILGAIADIAVSGGIGSIAILLAGRDTGLFVAEAGSALVWAAAGVLRVAIVARIYQRLAAAPTVPAAG
jgi:hypothetical protein